MSEQQIAQTDQEKANEQIEAQVFLRSSSSDSSSSSNSPTNSISLIRLDELSSFGATKQSRLPTLIRLSSQSELDKAKQANSMPTFSVEHMERQLDQQQSGANERVQASLPSQVRLDDAASGTAAANQTKEIATDKENEADLSDGFQVVDMVSADLIGPSLPQAPRSTLEKASEQRAALISSQQLNQHPSHLGDSLIEMIVNLKNENQSLVRALETNNEYVKERLSEFKRVNEESKRREARFALERAEHEHQARKLQRQNVLLSERLKSMEAKLKDMKLEVSESLNAAHSSKASSVRDESAANQLYPMLDTGDSFANPAMNQHQQAVTMQVGEVDSNGSDSDDNDDGEPERSLAQLATLTDHSPTAPMETDSLFQPQQSTSAAVAITTTTTTRPATESTRTEPMRVGAMSKEELSKHFDANKAEFYAMDEDPMKQCDKLEQQLNDIGKRDYEICLLQQQLNIYRQDFRLERMANLEAKLQIERLKADIDRLCLDRLNERRAEEEARAGAARHHIHRGHHHKSNGPKFDPAAAADAVMGKLGHHLSKKAAKSAAKAAKYASKQAHREEKIAAAAAAHAAQSSQSGAGASATGAQTGTSTHGHRRHHSHLHGLRNVRSEVVNDLLSTANKAMLTGYKMASTHVNLALDKLSQFEQSQAGQLATNQNKPSHAAGAANKAAASGATTHPMQPPSVD